MRKGSFGKFNSGCDVGAPITSVTFREGSTAYKGFQIEKNNNKAKIGAVFQIERGF